MGAFSIWHWLVVLGIVILIFGGKKLRGLGGDVGASIQAFRQSVKDEPAAGDAAEIAGTIARREQQG